MLRSMEKYRNLEKKSVFDFTEDAALINEITGVDITGKGGGISKEYYLKANGTLIKAYHLLQLADAVNDKELKRAASALCKRIETESSKNEENGLIID